MAEGRFLSRSISTNEQLASVSIDAAFLFSWCIPHLDVDGRLAGSVMYIKANVVPLRDEITIKRIPKLLDELGSAVDSEGTSLVVWYEVGRRQVLTFPGFARQQKLRRDREGKSRLPALSVSARILAGVISRSAPGPAPGVTPGVLPEQHPDRLRECASQVEVEVQVQEEVQEHTPRAGEAKGSFASDVVRAAEPLFAKLGGTPRARQVVTNFLEGIPRGQSPLTWIATLDSGILSGLQMPLQKPAAPGHLLVGLEQFLLASRGEFSYSAANVIAFVRRVRRDEESDELRKKTPSGAKDRTSRGDPAPPSSAAMKILSELAT